MQGARSAAGYADHKFTKLERKRRSVRPTNREHEEPVKKLGRILYKGLSLWDSFFLTSRLNNSEGEEKKRVIQQLESFLEEKRDRAFIDTWRELADAQLATGQREKAVETYRIYLQISPNMRSVFSDEVETGELPKEILE